MWLQSFGCLEFRALVRVLVVVRVPGAYGTQAVVLLAFAGA